MSLHYSQTHIMHSPQSPQFPPIYSFSDLQDIWKLQKEILDKYKSTQVPFVILDQDNTGLVSSKDFAYRLIARGFPCNTALYLKFFAFLDTNCDGFINIDDWTEGFKNIGSRLVEARCKAREQLQALNSTTPTHYRHVSSIDGYSTTPAKHTLDLSSTMSWTTSKVLENNTTYPMSTVNRENINASCRNLRAYDNNLGERDSGLMKRINLRVNEQGSRHIKGLSFDATSSGNIYNKERSLNTNLSNDIRKESAERINQRVDNILKGIETRKALLSESVTENRSLRDKKRPESIEMQTNLSQNLLSSLKGEISSGSQTQKAEEIHQSIKKFSAETIGALRSKIGPEISPNQVAEASGGRSSDTYAPSVTSIAAIEEENPEQFIKFGRISTFLDKTSGRKEDDLVELENSLQAKITKSNVPALEVHKNRTKDSVYASEGSNRGPDTKDSTKSGSLLSKKHASPQESKRSLASQSSASVTEGNLSRLDQIKKSFNAERRKNSKSIAVPTYSSSEKEIETPSWREFPKNFPVSNSEEEDILETIEKLLEQQGDRAEALRSLKKGDLARFPHLKMFVKSLDDQEAVAKCFGEGERGRQHTRGVRRRSRTKSMIELRVKGDLVLEIEREVQRRRAITPQSSVCHTPRTVREKSDRIANAEKMIESLREFGKKSMRMRVKSKSVAIGAELAKEILEGKDNKEFNDSGSNSMYSRVQEKLRGERKYGEAKKTCKEIIETFTGIKKGPKIIGEGALNNIGYSIQTDEVTKRNLYGRERGLRRREDDQETENQKRSRLKRVIDELSQEAASMEISLSKSRVEHKMPILQQSTRNCEQLWKVVKGNDVVKQPEKQSLPEKRRVKSFIRGSISSSSQKILDNKEEFNADQYKVQAQLQERLNQTKMLNRYSKMANDLGTFSVRIDKPERQASISPMNGTRSSKSSSINVSNLLNLQTELTGRGKSFLQNQYTRLDVVNKEMNQTTRSQKRIGLSKF